MSYFKEIMIYLLINYNKEDKNSFLITSSFPMMNAFSKSMFYNINILLLLYIQFHKVNGSKYLSIDFCK